MHKPVVPEQTLKGLSLLKETPHTQIKAAFFDVDGTLVRRDHSISQTSKDAIKKLLENGVSVGLASGRPLFSITSLIEELALTGPHLLFSGALLIGKTPESKTISHPLPESLLTELIAEQESYVELYTADNIYIKKEHVYADLHHPYLGKKPLVADLRAIANTTPILKAEIMGKTSEVLTSSLYQRLLTREDVTTGNAHGAAHPEFIFTNITSREACRYSGFKTLTEQLGITAHEVISFGDGGSDLPFLTSARLGVAMGNSSEEVKKKVEIVTKGVEEDGVSYAIELLYS
jgi:Cof subfamily protein (haloacid dehalogenase superfamily)